MGETYNARVGKNRVTIRIEEVEAPAAENQPPEQQDAAKPRKKRKNGQQGTAGSDEQLQRAEEMRTSGRKGCKSPRINMAFTPSNYEFVRIISRIRGETLTKYTNWIIEQYRLEHPSVYEDALKLIQQTGGKSNFGNTKNSEKS